MNHAKQVPAVADEQPSLIPLEISNGEMQTPNFQEVGSQEEKLDARAFSSILVSTKMQTLEDAPGASHDPYACILEMMNSQPVQAILNAASSLSASSGISQQDALQQIVLHFRKIDTLWSQVLIKEGLAHISSQFH